MSNNNSNGASVGISGTTALQIAFIVLKLCGVIKWSWVWVLSPTWISLALGVIFLIVVVLVKLWIRGDD